MTGLLLDSNALLWWMLDRDALSPSVRDRLLAGKTRVAVSVASVWELEIKRRSGKLLLTGPIWDDVRHGRIDILPIETGDAIKAAHLPMHHRDPFDRMIIAQALNRGLTVVTADRTFDLYGARVLRT